MTKNERQVTNMTRYTLYKEDKNNGGFKKLGTVPIESQAKSACKKLKADGYECYYEFKDEYGFTIKRHS